MSVNLFVLYSIYRRKRQKLNSLIKVTVVIYFIFVAAVFIALDQYTIIKQTFMSERSPVDDPFVSFDQQQQQQSSPTVTETKQRIHDLYDDQSMKDIDQIQKHTDNSTDEEEYHSSDVTNKNEHRNGINDNNYDKFHLSSLNSELFPLKTNENEKGKLLRKEKKLNEYTHLWFSFSLSS